MPDRGHWTLRCQNCLEDFALELKPGEHLIDYVKSHMCPHCHKRPNESRFDKGRGAWHHVIEFRSRISS
jgi:hypothetical protein